ncbi:MAG: tRNA (adenosine(37)-N6)-dimethylallyltransferase MiaA [Rhodobacteraceae bacterium]|nr:tRNA (adenosine(37)-N6)-dimethylallyltransferase MiaA [Paracoccaceae bacterium]
MDLDLAAVSSDRPVLIAGPTASGKSALALRIAEHRGGVIVNADALQVWSCWRILTARPTPEEESRATHALFGHLDPGADWSVGQWLRAVAPFVTAWRQGGPRPIIVGGTGLYFAALTEGLAEVPPIAAEIRHRADHLLRDGGLQGMIAALDGPTRERIDLRNPARVQRAWEVLTGTGRGLAEWLAAGQTPLLGLDEVEALRLEIAPAALAGRIDRRFDLMLDAGALDEVRRNLDIWDPAAPWAKAIGARELVAHAAGMLTLEQAREQAKAASRQYAKRQRTWQRSRMAAWKPVLVAPS